MLKSTHFDEEHSLLVLQFDGVYTGAEAQRALTEFVRSRNILSNHVLIDARTVASADMTDSDGALMEHFIRSLPFSREQVRSTRYVVLLAVDANKSVVERVRKVGQLARLFTQWREIGRAHV